MMVKFLIGLMPALLLAGPAVAGKATSNRFVTLGTSADAPAGYLEMCARAPRSCALTPLEAEPAPITTASCLDLYATMFLRRSTESSAVSSCFSTTTATATATATAPFDRLTPTAAIEQVAQSSNRRSRQTRAGSAELKLLRRISWDVNHTIRQRSDDEIWGTSEFWTRPTSSAAGDCEDLAIEKRARLVEAGFDPRRLSYAVVFRRSIGLHVVLVARLPEGDMVLDSRTPRVRKWSDVSYRWLRVQAPGNPAAWHVLAG